MAEPRIVDLGADEIQTLAKLRPYSVIVEKRGEAAVAVDAYGRIVAGPDTDHAAVIQAAVNSVGPAGGTIFIRRATYTIKRPITFADETRVRVKGELSYSPLRSTVLKVDSSFPDQRYVFECVRQSSAKYNATIEIEDLHVWNPNWSTVKAGFLYWDGKVGGHFGGPKLRRCYAHYMWRGIHIRGVANYGTITDFHYDVPRADVSVDAALIVEAYNSVDFTAPFVIHRMFATMMGSANNAIRIDGSSFHIRDAFIFGGAPAGRYDNFSDAVIRLGKDVGTWTCYLDGIHISDTSAEQTALILDGVDASNPLTRNNRVVFTSMVPKYVRFRNSAYNNTVVVRQSPDGVPTIDDSGAGPGNTVIVEPGSRLWSQSEAGKIAATKCRVVDLRPGASATGTATIPAGSTSVTVNHGLLAAPSRVLVTPTANVGAVWVESITSTSFTIRCSAAPPADTAVYWYAEI
jgi:hypothetical protein